MSELLVLFGAFLAIEGAIYAGAPALARRAAFAITRMSDADLRRGGLLALCAGVFLVWLIKG